MESAPTLSAVSKSAKAPTVKESTALTGVMQVIAEKRNSQPCFPIAAPNSKSSTPSLTLPATEPVVPQTPPVGRGAVPAPPALTPRNIATATMAAFSR